MHETHEATGDAPGHEGHDAEAVARLQAAHENIRGQLQKVIVGQEAVIEEMMIALFAQGHTLLIGVPGLAKTLLVSSLAEALSLSFKRIQFTPDLMPSDVTGTEVLQEDPESGQRHFKFMQGPVFANVVLADEINRTPPKTQAALLEAMQEKKVSTAGTDWPLEEPFFVLATQNPIEQEGTYPLPEAQLDRFLFNITVGYPTGDEEVEIMRRASGPPPEKLEPVLDRDEIRHLQGLVRRTPVADHLTQYAAALVRATRPETEEAPDFIRAWLAYGAGPRASICMMLAAKSRAILRGRCFVALEDMQAVAPPILRHRILLNFAARSEGLSADQIIARLLETIPSDEKLYEAAASA